MTLQTFGEFERQLNPEAVCQIDSIEQGQIRIAGMTIPISETYRDRFMARVGARPR